MMSDTTKNVLVSAEQLRERIETGTRTIVLDVRWQLDRPDGSDLFAQAHIPGAIYVNLETELSEHGEPQDGRHPLPSLATLQRAARRWGMRDGDCVVAYDDAGGTAAARAWWVLRDAGVDARILDGGLGAWRAMGGDLESGSVASREGDVTLTQGALPQLSIDEAAQLPESGVLLDVRVPERFRGDTEPIDPVAGHIPGARNLPTGANLDSSGRFLSPELLRERFEAAGLTPGTPIGVYCGSGGTATHTIAALTLAGFDASLYPGSWSQWSNTPGRPVATGDEA